VKVTHFDVAILPKVYIRLVTAHVLLIFEGNYLFFCKYYNVSTDKHNTVSTQLTGQHQMSIAMKLKMAVHKQMDPVRFT
jgi:hypothetical protein